VSSMNKRHNQKVKTLENKNKKDNLKLSEELKGKPQGFYSNMSNCEFIKHVKNYCMKNKINNLIELYKNNNSLFEEIKKRNVLHFMNFDEVKRKEENQKYPKPLRIRLGKIIKEKKYLTEQLQNFLVGGLLVFEEKMDGKQTSIELNKYILWVEDLKYKHSIKYRVPARYALFDIYEKNTRKFLNRDDKINLYLDIKNKYENIPPMFPVPLVARKTIENVGEIPELVRESYYIDSSSKDRFMEGLVIKQDRSLYYPEAISGKFVRKEFTEGITTNYLRKQLEKNIIDISVPILYEYPDAISENDPYLNSDFYKEIKLKILLMKSDNELIDIASKYCEINNINKRKELLMKNSCLYSVLRKRKLLDSIFGPLECKPRGFYSKMSDK
jgi:hypothetical protein